MTELRKILIGLSTGWPGVVWSLPNEFDDFSEALEWSGDSEKPTLEAVLAKFEAQNVPPLADQLDAVFSQQSADLQAQFSTLRTTIKLELEQGRIAIAKRVIEMATIPEELEAQRQALLTLFPKGDE